MLSCIDLNTLSLLPIDISSGKTQFVKDILSILVKVSVLFIVGSYVTSRQEKYEMERFKQEVERDRECREVHVHYDCYCAFKNSLIDLEYVFRSR